MGIWPKRDPREPRCSPGAPATPRAHVHVPMAMREREFKHHLYNHKPSDLSLLSARLRLYKSETSNADQAKKNTRRSREHTHYFSNFNGIRAPQPRQPPAGLCHVRMRGIRIRGDACARRESDYLEARVSCVEDSPLGKRRVWHMLYGALKIA